MNSSNNTDNASSKKLDVTLHPVGDKELWYAQAPDSSWRFPLFVEWKHDRENDIHYGLVYPALAPYNSQLQVLMALLSHHDALDSKEMWLLSRRLVETLLLKAPGLTPQYYYHWPDGDFPPMPPGFKALKFTRTIKEDQRSVQPTDQPFAVFVSKKSGLPSSVVNVVLKSIGTYGSEWLLESRRPIELGFCRIVALPFRANWKEIVTAKFRKAKLGKLFASTNDNQEAMYDQLSKIGMESGMTSSHNIALRNGRIQYTLEAIPTKKFKDENQSIELKRIRHGHKTYIAHHESAVETLYGLAISSLANYVKQVAYPFAKVRKCGGGGIARLVSAGGKQVKMRGVPLSDLPVHIIPPSSGFSILEEEGDFGFVPPSLTKVSKMPAVLPTPENMRSRQEWRDMDQLDNEGGGSAGLPVRYDEEGDAQGEPVLPVAENSTGDSGLDGKGDRQ